MSRNLRDYLTELRERPGELVDVHRRVSPIGEVGAVVKALEPFGKPAVLFHDVADSDLPVVMGLFGTRDRLAAALGCDRRELVGHVLDVLAGPLPTTRRVAAPPIDDVVVTGDRVNLDSLPIGVHSRDDAGRYLTSGVVVARDPRSGAINTGMYRIMVTGPTTMTINAAPDHDLGRIFAKAAREGGEVPIAIVLGHHPGYFTASQLKHPVHVDTHQVAGALLGAPLDVADGLTSDLEVPADAELVIEAMVRPADRIAEGPFGEFTYYYGQAMAPVCTVTAVRRRSDAIFHDLHPTHDEHRCLWLFPGREARLFDAVRRVVPSVSAVRIPFHGGSLSAYLSITKTRQGDGKQALLAAFASDHFLKHVIVVDDDVDVFDETAVLWAANVRTQADRDMMVIPHAKGIRMDPSATPCGDTGDRTTTKVGVDATRPLAVDFPTRADLPFAGYEDVRLADYVSAEDVARVAVATHYRRQMEE